MQSWDFHGYERCPFTFLVGDVKSLINGSSAHVVGGNYRVTNLFYSYEYFRKDSEVVFIDAVFGEFAFFGQCAQSGCFLMEAFQLFLPDVESIFIGEKLVERRLGLGEDTIRFLDDLSEVDSCTKALQHQVELPDVGRQHFQLNH